MRFFIFLLLFSFSLLANDKVALVIGNKNYSNQTGLKNPIKDAQLIRDTLEGMGFEVLEAYNKDLDDLGKKLDSFIAKAQNAKIAVVYYAGHGIGVGSKNYLIPLGATNLSVDNLGRKLMSVDELKGAVAKAQGFGVVLFDACRNSFFSGTISGISSGRASRALVQPTVTRANVLVSFSTQAGTKAEDDVNGGEHSPYAIALSEKLQTNMDIRQLMGSIRDRVYSLTSKAQYPIEENLLGGHQYCLSGSCPQSQVRVVEKIVYRDRVVEPTAVPAPKVNTYVPPKVIPAPVVSTSTSKWIKPTNSVCRANGGKLYKGVCQATWQNAKKICSASGAKLPSRDDFHKVITDCGGIPDADSNDEWDKNRNNSQYQNCYKQKGFTNYDWYWTREEKDSSLACSVYFEAGFDGWDGKSSKFLALCVR